MQIDIDPETERLVREQLLTGHFQTAGEVVRAGVEALSEKYVTPRPRTGQQLIDASAKVQGILTDQEIDSLFARDKSISRPVDLE